MNSPAGWKSAPKDNSTFTAPGKQETATVLHRFPFTSALKRMAVVLRVEARAMPDTAWVVAKGAPEVIERHLASKPANYEAGYKKYAAEGARRVSTACEIRAFFLGSVCTEIAVKGARRACTACCTFRVLFFTAQ